jgi:hypothetical protein
VGGPRTPKTPCALAATSTKKKKVEASEALLLFSCFQAQTSLFAFILGLLQSPSPAHPDHPLFLPCFA